MNPGNTLGFVRLAVTVGVPAYHLAMTVAFDGSRGTDQRFTDALSGSDGTSDPSVMMPVLDVYPDALSAQLPADVLPVLPSIPAVAGVRAEPVIGPAGRSSGTRPAQPQRAQAQRVQPQRAQPQRAQPQRAAQRPTAARQAPPRQAAVPSRPQVQPQRPITPAAAPAAGQQPHTISWQGKSMSTSDIAAMVRAGLSGQAAPQGQQSFQATHPQSMGSASPQAVAPAAPMASQYSGRGQARNDAREQSRERRRTSVPSQKRSSSIGAVIVFMVVILFATGLGQKILQLITELLNR